MRRILSIVMGLSLAVGAWAADAPAEVGSPAVRGEITAVSNIAETVMFYTCALIIVGGGIGVVCSGNVVRMAMWLFTAFGGVALLFFLLQAHFLGAVQLIVYVGGILVLIVFGIMLTSSSPWLRFDVRRWELVVAGVVSLALCAGLAHVLVRTPWGTGRPTIENIKIDTLGRMLITDYLVPFELAAVLLMVIMIGAAYLARQPRHRAEGRGVQP